MSNTNNKKSLPQINSRKIVAKSGLFKIEQVDLEFSNGETRIFERMAGSGRGAVMVVPFINDDEFSKLFEQSQEIQRMIFSLKRSLKEKLTTTN